MKHFDHGIQSIGAGMQEESNGEWMKNTDSQAESQEFDMEGHIADRRLDGVAIPSPPPKNKGPVTITITRPSGVAPPRIELGTHGFSVRCSTD
jgi:hypothetical protein